MSGSDATYPSLRERVVLVSGGGSGIGAALVEAFVEQGSLVVFLDLAVAASEALVDAMGERYGRRPRFVACDVTDTPALRAAVAAVEAELGPVSVLVNNAGNDDRHDFSTVTELYWDERIAVNLRHYFFAAQAVAPGMAAAGRGSIVNLSSIAWMIPAPRLSVYETAKAGIVGMTRALAHELGPAGLRVNCVSPGAVLTERQRRLWMSDEDLAEVLGRQCLRRHVMPEDVARLVLFLASDDSRAITNQNHIVDGGWI